MKFFVALALLVAAAAAAPPLSSDKDATITSQSNTPNIGDGIFGASWQTSNGISAQQQGSLKNVGTENEGEEIVGGYSYIGPDGVEYALSYVANEFGFQPKANYLPQSPK